MFQNRWLSRVLCLTGVVISVATAVLVTIWFQNQKGDQCPRVIAPNRFSLPYSLYYMKNDGEPNLWSFHEGMLQKLAIETSPIFRLSPDGARMLRVAVPQNEGDPASVTILTLPLSGDDDISEDMSIKLPSVWSSLVFGLEWADSQHIAFHIRRDDAIETVILDINSGEHHSIHWSLPSDLWDRGTIVFDHDLRYFVYTSNSTVDGAGNPRTGEAELRLVALSKPDTTYDLLQGYASAIGWQAETSFFVYQGDDYKWYRVDANEVVANRPDLSPEYGRGEYHPGVGARLFSPALSPNGQYLAARAYLPNEQLETLLVLFEGSGMVDLCLHGDYRFNDVNGESRSGEWSPDSKYLAFSIYTGESAGVYIYDVENHVIGLIDTLESPASAWIIGWGH